VTKLIRALVFVSLAATLTLGAHAEFSAGQFVGMGVLAPVLPAAIDCYVLAALISGLDVWPSLLILATSVAGGEAYIGSQAKHASALTIGLGAGVGLLLVVVLLRVEELAKKVSAQAAAAQAAKVAAQRADVEERQARRLAEQHQQAEAAAALQRAEQEAAIRLEQERRWSAEQESARKIREAREFAEIAATHPAPKSPPQRPAAQRPAAQRPAAAGKLSRDQGVAEIRRRLAQDPRWTCGQDEQAELAAALGMSVSWWEKRWRDVRQPQLVRSEQAG
jgi:hypothetical protein